MRASVPLSIPEKLIHENKKTRFSYLLILSFIVLNGSLLMLHAGKILALVFPSSSLLVGLVLQQRSPALYVGFTWWLWFLGILIRRMIDYYSSTYNYGPWNLTPMIVTSISIVTLFRHAPQEFKGHGKAMILAAVGVLYGVVVTYIHTSSRDAVLGLMGWLSPISFCFYIYLNWADYPKIKNAIHQSFLWGMMIMGPYGIYQYIIAPGWDCFYLENPLTTKTFGLPEPFGMRVFGTMDAPHTFAGIIAVSVYVIVASSGQNYKYIGLITGMLTLLLTSVRTVWISLIIGLLCLFPSLPKSKKLMFIIFGAAIAYIVYSLAMSDLFYETITKRFESLQDSEDGSFTVRRDALLLYAFSTLTEVVGKGFSSGGIILEGGIPVGDNGIFYLLFSLGLLGGIPYLFGVSFLSVSLFRQYSFRADTFLKISRAVVVSSAFQSLFVVITESSFAMVIWGFLGLGIASIRYSQHRTDILNHS
jgi:hypothetical protein